MQQQQIHQDPNMVDMNGNPIQMQQMIGPDGQPVMMDPNMMQQPGQQYTEEQMQVSGPIFNFD